MGGSFDVFFSYSTADHLAVERVARALHDRGIQVFLDRWYLAPGLPWPQALERTLAACNAVAMFIGAKDLGPWQQRERDLALDRQTREPSFPLIPVLLTNTTPGLGFLRLNTWVDLSKGIDDVEALGILIAAIRGEPPGPLHLQASSAARAAVCPYRGLQAFREEDEPFFFGRTTFAETLTATVLRHSFVAVVGASGSGKSSVVRAGLIPRLRRRAGECVWDAVTVVPKEQPLIRLSAALLPLLEPDLSEVKHLAEVADLANHLQTGKIELRDVVARVLAKQPGTERLLLFIDQWEEIYALHEVDAREAFIGQLVKAAASEAVRVVLTIRGDFMGRVLENRELSDCLQGGLVTIGTMTRDELAETIVQPATITGLGFEPGLLETVLDEVGEEPGGLPLLEYLLEGLWTHRRGNLLTHDGYVRLGRVSGAIAHRAEAVFERLNEAERQAAQRLLMLMVRAGEGVEDSRRRVVLPAADAVANATIRNLVKERLLVTERDGRSGQVMVEVAHEALIRRWQRLREWIDADREFLRTRERIAFQARLWEDNERASERLLPPGRPLAEGEDLLTGRRGDLEPLLIKFIEASAAEARASDLRKRQRTRAVLTGMAVISLIALCFGGVAWWQRAEAKRSAAEAQYSAYQARLSAEAAQLSESRALANLAKLELEHGYAANAMRLALAALPMRFDSPERAYSHVAEDVLLNSMPYLRERRRFLQEMQGFSTFSPDGQTVATVSLSLLDWTNDAVRLWEVATGKEIAVLRPDAKVDRIAFSPDGQTVAVISGEAVRLWEVATGKEIAFLRPHAKVDRIAFSPDGRMVGTTHVGGFGEDTTVRLWEVATSKEIAILRHDWSLAFISFAAAFGPEGRMMVAVANSPDEVGVWEVASGKKIAVLRGMANYIAFNPDGRTLATTSSVGETRLWEVASGKEIAVLRGMGDYIAFSPDGRTLATIPRFDGDTRLWEVASGKEIAVLRGMANYIAFSPDGRMVAGNGSSDNTVVRLREVATGEEVAVLRHEEGVNDVAFTSDGQMLATASGQGTVRLWNAATDGVLRGHKRGVVSVKFSPDGRMLATGSNSKYDIRLWEVATGKEVAVLAVPWSAASADWGVGSNHSAQMSDLSVSFSPDGRMLATAGLNDQNAVQLWEVATSKEIAALRNDAVVNDVAFSPDGRTLATASGLSYSADNMVRLWDVATHREMAALRGPAVTSVAFSPDGQKLATGSTDNTAGLWDVASGKEITVLRHQGEVNDVAFSPDGRTLATGSKDNTARLWAVAAGKEVAIAVLHHEGGVTSVAFSPDGQTLATGSKDNTARLWEIATGNQIAVLRHDVLGQEAASTLLGTHVTSVAFSPDGRTLATGSSDNTVRLWPVGQHMVDLACARVHDLPFSARDQQRFGITDEWCSPEVSAALRVKLGLDNPEATANPDIVGWKLGD